MGPKLGHGPSLDVPEVLEQLDDFLGTAPVVKDTPLNIVEVNLKLLLV